MPFGDDPARHLDGLLAPRRIDRTSAARRAAAAFLLSKCRISRRLFLLDMSVIVPLVITVLLPFVPVLFVLIPVDEILPALGRAVL